MTAQQRVKEKYPDAIAETPLGLTTFIYANRRSLQLLGIGKTKDEAWQSAAARISESEDQNDA